jgi:hypothetical protein
MELSWDDGTILADTIVASDGTFSAPFTVPASSAGSHTVYFTDLTSRYFLPAPFDVTQGQAPPAAPTNLAATPAGTSGIRLTWRDNSSNESGFEISNGVSSKTLGANSTSYTWGGLAPGTYMCFRIRAYNSAGNSSWDPNVPPWYVCTTTSPLFPARQKPLIYAGYSAHPSHGTVSFAQANWTVPAITSCKDTNVLRYEAQVAVWAGLWGDIQGGNANAWLPQVGTVSGCTRIYKAQQNNYAAVVEIYNAKHNAKGFIPLFTNSNGSINAGDHMYAHIEYIGLGVGSHAGQLKFWYYVSDLTTSTSASGYLYTTISGVRVADAAYQGGIIVERVVDSGVSGDLPKFAKINISNIYVGQNPFNPGTAWTVYRWDLKQPGKVYATTGPINNFPIPRAQGRFSVSWASY